MPDRVHELAILFLQRSDQPVSRTDVRVMQLLRGGPRRITDLAAEEHVKQPGISLLVNRLEERGWASRCSDPTDGRVVLVALTGEGGVALTAIEEGYAAMLADHMAALSEADVRSLTEAVRILDGLIAALRREED